MARKRNYLLAFAAGALVAVAAAAAIIRADYRRTLSEWRTWLSGSAGNRASVLGLVLAERYADARVTAGRPSVRSAMKQPGGGAAERLAPLLDSVASAYGYDAIFLFDRRLRVIASSTSPAARPGADLDGVVQRTLADNRARLEIVSDPGDTSVLAIAAPVPPAGRGQPLGAVVTLISPHRRLFPIVLAASGRPQAGEIILARVEDDRARLIAATWPTPRAGPERDLRLDTAGAARQRLFQQASPFESYVDYTGTAVFGGGARVPGSNWVLVLKVNRSEALTGFARTTRLVTVALVLAIAVWGLGLRALMKRLQAQERSTLAALEASERRFRDAIEAMELMAVIIDREGRIVFANDALLAQVGRTREEVYGQDSIALLLPPEGREQAYETLRVAIAQGVVPRTYDNALLARDGQVLRLRSYSTVLKSARGAVEGVAVISENVTALRKTEDELRQSEERYRALVEGARDVIFVIDPQGRLAWLNPAFEEMTGWPRDEWLGRRFEDLVAEEDRAESRAVFSTVMALHDRRPTAQLRLQSSDGGTRLGEFTGTPQVKDGRVVGILGVCRDITDRAVMEQRLRQSSRMEAVGQLAGGIAHDFNNLLTVIIGSAELLLADMPADNPWHDDVSEIRTSAGRAAMMTRQLLAFSRRQMLAPRQIDLNTIVTGAAGMLRRLIGEHISLDVRLASRIGTVRADPGQIEQVIVNLAVNARDAMPGGGTLTITTTELRNDEPVPLGSTHVPRGEWCVLEVRDSGVGMQPAVLARAFEPFFTTKPPGKGTGLGLASAYGVIKQSEGYIAVESTPGRGATFRIYLPRVADASEAAGDAPPSAAPAPRGSETILVAEDEATVRAVATQALERCGYRVLPVASGAEALALMAGSGTAVDLLLSDVVMPGMDGTELAERLVKRQPGLKVLFMSGYAEDAVESRGVKGLGGPLLVKPFTPDELARKVREVLDRRA